MTREGWTHIEQGKLRQLHALADEAGRLRELVKKAVDLGLALEEAYDINAKRFHNVNDWEEAEHDRVQQARNALCGVLDEMDRPTHAINKEGA